MTKDQDEGKNEPELTAPDQQLREIERKFRGLPKDSWRAATEFKSGELTTEEEQLVEKQGLSPLNYIPQRTLEKHARAFEDYAEKMRDPVFRKRDERERRNRERFEDFGYGKFLLGILVLNLVISERFDWPIWPMGVFCILLLLAILEIGYSVYAHRIASWPGGFLLMAALLISGIYCLRFYNQMESDFRDSENWVVSPTIDQDSVSEIGYIYDERREIDFRSTIQNKTIRWWIKIPSTNRIYSCDWASGYSRFSKDDGIEVIHKSSSTDTDFIVGLHGDQRDQSAACS
jgi:hypothetical protein